MKTPTAIDVMGLIFLLIGVPGLVMMICMPYKIVDTLEAITFEELAHKARVQISHVEYLDEQQRHSLIIHAKYLNKHIELSQSLRKCPLAWLGISEVWEDIEPIPLPRTL